MGGIIGYRIWIVAVGDDGRPQLRSFNRIEVTKRWPYFGEGDAHFTMGVPMGGDTAGRSLDDQILCNHHCSTMDGCRNGRPLRDDWEPSPCMVSGCPEDHPRMSNTLGFHAFKTMAQLKSALMEERWMEVGISDSQSADIGFVIAEVELWGHVVEHETGWRAEYSRPHRLLEFFPTKTVDVDNIIHRLECLYLDIDSMETPR